MKEQPTVLPAALTLGGTVHAQHRRLRKPLKQTAQSSHLLQAAVMGQTAPNSKEIVYCQAPAAPRTPSRLSSPTLPVVATVASNSFPVHTGLTDAHTKGHRVRLLRLLTAQAWSDSGSGELELSKSIIPL